MKRILTGLKPSGELTLGSYIGGIKGTIKDNFPEVARDLED